MSTEHGLDLIFGEEARAFGVRRGRRIDLLGVAKFAFPPFTIEYRLVYTR